MNTQQSSRLVLVCFGFALLYVRSCIETPVLFILTVFRSSLCRSLSRNQFLSVLTYVFLIFSLNYNDGVFSSSAGLSLIFVFSLSFEVGKTINCAFLGRR